jgi:hypothetical protein
LGDTPTKSKVEIDAEPVGMTALKVLVKNFFEDGLNALMYLALDALFHRVLELFFSGQGPLSSLTSSIWFKVHPMGTEGDELPMNR